MGFNPLKLIPGYTAINHIASNLFKGIREEGLMGALKVVGQGLSKDWALGIAAAFVPGGQVLTGITLGAAGLDLVGALDLKSERRARQAEQQPQQVTSGAGSW